MSRYTYQQERELLEMQAQLARLNAELRAALEGISHDDAR